jgi:hypothetical protein
MSKQEKLLEKLHRNPKNVRFEDIDTLLSGLGFEKRQRGSHVTFSLKAGGRIIVPVKKPFILPVYVREVLDLLEEAGLI